MTNLTFGIKTYPQQTTYHDMLQIWKEADETPAFDHAWLFDHYAPIFGSLDGPCLEGWTVLAAFAAETKRIRIGLMVTGNTYRHPAVLASIAATVDIISNGRLDLGIGAGWNEYEHTSMGIPLYKPGDRIRRLDEACEIIKLLYTQHLTNFSGRYYHLTEARREPKPVQKPYPPFVIGGSGEQLTLRVVAKHAQVWNFVGGTPKSFKHKVSILHQHCADIGRDPAEIILSTQVRIEDGNVSAALETTKAFMDVGANHFVYTLMPPFPESIVQQLANNVIERLK